MNRKHKSLYVRVNNLLEEQEPNLGSMIFQYLLSEDTKFDFFFIKLFFIII